MTDSDNVTSLADAARSALERGDFSRGVELTGRLVDACPAHAVYHCWRSHAMLMTGDVRGALTHARQAVELAPQTYQAHLAVGCAAYQMGRTPEAQKAFENAVELSGRSAKLLAEHANFLASARAPGLAEQAAVRAIEADASSADAWAALGLAQFRQRRLAEAESSLTRAIEIDPDNLRGQTYMARLLRATGRQKEAAALAKTLGEDLYRDEFAESIPIADPDDRQADAPRPAAGPDADAGSADPSVAGAAGRGRFRWGKGLLVVTCLAGALAGAVVFASAGDETSLLVGGAVALVSAVALLLAILL
jgi:tetratricopeptide (TPR) repeat protein